MLRVEIALSSLLLLLGCGGGASPASPAPADAPKPPVVQAAPTPAPVAPQPAAAATDHVDDPSFELAASPVGPYTAGKLGSFGVSLKPRGVYHVNQEYPISISLHADEAVSLPKAELAKADAATFGEKLARFDVPFTAAKAGSHRVEAKVRFAVCTPENCVPDERTLALMLPVQ
jgi:hypothetical protein